MTLPTCGFLGEADLSARFHPAVPRSILLRWNRCSVRRTASATRQSRLAGPDTDHGSPEDGRHYFLTCGKAGYSARRDLYVGAGAGRLLDFGQHLVLPDRLPRGRAASA